MSSARRKLILEKVIDGEIGDLSCEVPGCESVEAIRSGAPSAERFLVNTADLQLLRKHPDVIEEFRDATPYDHMWVELHEDLTDEEQRAASDYAGQIGLDTGYKTVDSDVCVHYTRNPEPTLHVYALLGRGQFLSYAGMVTSAGVKLCAYAVRVARDVGIPDAEYAVQDVITHARETYAAMVALCNIKGDVLRSASEAPAKVNKKRVASGKAPLRGYTYIRLNREAPSTTGAGASGVGRAVHLVRGHFKRRSTGVFWWKPHFAGTLPGVDRVAYVVQPQQGATQ